MSRSNPKHTLAQQVIENLSKKILGGHYQPGDKLPTEPIIMAEQKVSRSVVREAMSHLQAAGLIETRHGVGSFVLEPPSPAFPLDQDAMVTIRDVIAMLELRISIETEAAYLAATRRSETHLQEMQRAIALFDQDVHKKGHAVDADFSLHLQIALATGNRYFEDILHHFGTATIPRTRLNLTQGFPSQVTDYLLRANQEHQQLFDAIVRQDSVAAREAMRLHLTNSKERLQLATKIASNQQ